MIKIRVYIIQYLKPNIMVIHIIFILLIMQPRHTHTHTHTSMR